MECVALLNQGLHSMCSSKATSTQTHSIPDSSRQDYSTSATSPVGVPFVSSIHGYLLRMQRNEQNRLSASVLHPHTDSVGVPVFSLAEQLLSECMLTLVLPQNSPMLPKASVCTFRLRSLLSVHPPEQ